MLKDRNEGCGGGNLFGARFFGTGGLERCCRDLLEERGRWRRRRRKELQELAQGRRAGMLRCSQGLVLVAALMSFIRPDSFSLLLSIPFSMGGVQLLVRCSGNSCFGL